MRKHRYIIILIFVIFILSGCGEKDLSEYGNSDLMKMSNRKPSAATKKTYSVSAPVYADNVEYEVVYGTPEPEYVESLPTPYVLTEEDKAQIIDDFHDALQEYYDSIHVKDNYDADLYFDAYDNDTVRQKEYEIASNTAYTYGISVEELFSFYPYPLQSTLVANLDKDQIRTNKENEGYEYLEDSYQKVVEEFLKRNQYEGNDINVHRLNNQIFIDITYEGLGLAMGLTEVFGDKRAKQDMNSALNMVQQISTSLYREMVEKYGLKKGIVTITCYDSLDPDTVLLIYSNGQKMYNILEDAEKVNYSTDSMLEHWEY